MTGSPVLYIPGNAGSSRQARSIASSAARQYFSERGGVVSNEFKNRKSVKPLDVFTADFNEDFSALHEPTLRAQRQYVLEAVAYITSLYPKHTRIFLIGHSMGGIVATSILPHADISGIITLSTPHALPPARFSVEMDRYYSRMHRNFVLNEINTPIFSICGGATDLMIPSETCVMPDRQSKNKKSIFSTSMEGCWTGVGHQVSVWCHQVRWRVARAILESQITGYNDTFRIMSNWLNDASHYIDNHAMAIDSSIAWEVHSDSKVFVDNLGSSLGQKGHLLPITSSNYAWSIMVGGGKVFGVGAINSPLVNLEVFLCNDSVVGPKCSPMPESSVSLYPEIQPGQGFPRTGEGVDESNAVAFLYLDPLVVQNARYLGLLTSTAEKSSRSWLMASSEKLSPIRRVVSQWRKFFSQKELKMTGVDFDSGVLFSTVEIPIKSRAVLSRIVLDGILENSLLVYKMKAEANADAKGM